MIYVSGHDGCSNWISALEGFNRCSISWDGGTLPLDYSTCNWRSGRNMMISIYIGVNEVKDLA